MHGSSLVLSVGDLLRNVGTQDHLDLQDIIIPQLSQDSPVSLTCEMTAVNEYTIFVRLADITTQIPAVCDHCAQPYTQDITVDDYDIRFGIPVEIHKTKHAHDAERDYDFPIDPKTETIDMTEAIYQSVMMSKPIISYCPDCQDQNTQDDIDEYDLYA